MILVDPADRVLLFRFDPPAPYPKGTGWLTPGGGLGPGEPPAAGAVRELYEETGQRVDPADAGPVVAVCSGQWSTPDGTVFDAVDSYFFIRARNARVDISRHEDLERDVLQGHRWWTLAELAITGDQVFPVGLAGLLERLLAGDVPDHPIRLPWR